MKTLKGLYAAFVVALIALFSAPAFSAGYSNAWYNEQQDGEGVFLIHENKKIFASWFNYDNAHRPSFLFFAGDLAKDLQSNKDYYEGPLYRASGTPPANYDASKLSAADVGEVRIVFNSTRSVTMTFSFTDETGGKQAGTRNLHPLNFGCEAPAVWNGDAGVCVTPMGGKVANPKRLPAGCMWPEDAACKQAVRDGTVQFVETPAKMTGYSNRPMMLGYFITSGGEYAIQPFYADTGEPFTANAFHSGVPQVMDWAQGTPNGGLQHYVSDGCFELRWFPSGAWANVQVPCP